MIESKNNIRSEQAKKLNFVDHFSGKFKQIPLTNQNAFYVNSHLAEIKKRSDFAYNNHKSIILALLEYLDKPIIAINKLDIKKYFDEVLDKKEIKCSTKETNRATLKSFFNHVESLLLDQNINYYNPVPSKEVYKFTQKDTDIKKQSEEEVKKLGKDQILKIIDYIKKNYTKNNNRMFVYFALCICSGARELEIATIKISDINLEVRYFETGFEKNARKSTKHTKKGLLFFFPKNFVPYLKNYLLPLKKKEEKWLFPSTRRSNSTHMTASAPTYYYRKIRKELGFDFSMHWFRHSMISYLSDNGLSLEDREKLLNHVVNRTQPKFYEHDEISKKRDLYDKYFPYYNMPYF